MENLKEIVRPFYTDCLTVNPREWSEDDVRRAYADALSLEAR